MVRFRHIVGGLLLCLACTIAVSIFFAFSRLNPTQSCLFPCLTKRKIRFNSDGNSHQLAVIVPFRDRFEELLVFAPYMQNFLDEQKVKHKIFIINQVDQHRFNRASLINVGHLQSREDCDYLAMHDIDLLPLNPALKYSYPKAGPFHIASPDLHPRYHYRTFVGGILLLTREDFELVNGLSNKYWGWGLEDDEFYARMKKAEFNISRPRDIKTGQKNTFKHIHDKNKRKRDTARLYNQREATRWRDHQTGLNTVQYRVVSKHNLMIDEASVTVINVELVCNYTVTPWCDHKPVKSSKHRR